jgi:mono/diheme cytochrome c family protein
MAAEISNRLHEEIMEGRMKNRMMATIVVGLLAVTIVNNTSAAQSKSGSKQQQIVHGEYLVKVIGQCGDCHTPMNEKGEFIPGKWLQGKKLDFAPTVPMPVWADTSPNIAGLPGWDHGKAVQFFMTGLAPNGQPARPPMPAYKMNRADADAVVAYLESLK